MGVAERVKYFSSFCSPGLARYLAYDNTRSFEEKQKILSLARQIASEKNRIKVWIEDFSEALRILREKGEVK